MTSIDILMATYNGAAFIAEQIESLLGQTVQFWRLVVRDDGSTDQTIEIINAYRKRFPDKITLIVDNNGQLGPALNFGRLLHLSAAPYIMFCDQDDVWLPEKIERTWEALSTMERRYGHEAALLVFTDLRVVDRSLRPIAPSLWRYGKINPDDISLNYLLTENAVTGCTVMINQSLRRLGTPIPSNVLIHHDWWFALIASVFGYIHAVRVPTILYRQHGDNNMGGVEERGLIPAVKNVCDLNRFRKRQIAERQVTLGQAGALYERCLQVRNISALAVDNRTLALIREYADLDAKPFLKRKKFLLANRLIQGSYLTRAKKFLFF